MAALYVYALTDEPVETRSVGDRIIESVPIDAVFAVCERRTLPPALSETELRRQHAIVLRLAESVSAIRPARFGSLVDEAELAAMIRGRADVVRNALEHVRGKAQMSLRIAAPKKAGSDTEPPVSGRAYLQRRRKQTHPDVPEGARAVLESVRKLVVEERTRAATSNIVTIYHLIRRQDVEVYQKHFAPHRGIGVDLTGPWPPFAFVPELWP